MKKVPTPYIADILNSIAQIETYLAEIKNDKPSFLDDIEKQDAVIRRLEIIGEASNSKHSMETNCGNERCINP